MPFDPNFPPIPSNQSSWSSVDDGFPNDWVAPSATPVGNSSSTLSPALIDGRFPNDWIAPTTMPAGNPWATPRQGPIDDGFPNDWIAPRSFSNPGSWGVPAPAQAPNYPSPGAMPSNNWAGVRMRPPSSGSPPVVPVSGQAPSAPWPWWNPPGAPGRIFDPWADQFIKGMQGLIDLFQRSGSGFGGGGGDPDAPGCKEEWDEARQQCAEWLSRPNPPKGPSGRYRNVEDCARGLVSERCGGNPYSR